VGTAEPQKKQKKQDSSILSRLPRK